MNKWPSIKVKGNLEKRYFPFQGDIHKRVSRTNEGQIYDMNCVISEFFVEFVSVYSAFTLEYLSY